MTITRLAIIATLTTALSGCMGGYQAPAEKLENSVYRYNDAVRWQRYEVASGYLPVDRREDYVQTQREAGDDLKILEYEIDQVRQTTENAEAEVIVRFTWLRNPSNIVQRTTIRQTWRYGEDKTWLMVAREKIERRPPSEVPLVDRL